MEGREEAFYLTAGQIMLLSALLLFLTPAMYTVTTPIEMINGSIRLFAFACFLNQATHSEKITPACFPEVVWLDDGAGGGIRFKETHTSEELKHGTKNLLVVTLGTTALATSKALEVVYGKVDAEDTSPQGSARVILYQIRCAFAHDPLNPVWSPTKRYKHTYGITVDIRRPSGKPKANLKIELHPPLLKDKRLNIDHVGGLAGYLGLLDFCRKTLNDHPKGNHPYLPFSEKS